MIIYQDWITRQDLLDNPDRIYLFGDNVQRQGFGGQAKEMRGEPNAIGIITKKKPEHTPDAYFMQWDWDNDRNYVTKLIDWSFSLIPKGCDIVIP